VGTDKEWNAGILPTNQLGPEKKTKKKSDVNRNLSIHRGIRAKKKPEVPVGVVNLFSCRLFGREEKRKKRRIRLCTHNNSGKRGARKENKTCRPIIKRGFHACRPWRGGKLISV